MDLNALQVATLIGLNRNTVNRYLTAIRNGKVYTEIVPNCRREILQAVIRGRVSLETVIHSDGWRVYNGLVDLGYQKHFRVNYGEDKFVWTSRYL